MKKNVFLPVLLMVFFISGCVMGYAQAPRMSPTTEAGSAEGTGSSTSDNTAPENNDAEQNAFPNYDVGSELDHYMISIEEQSDIIKAYLDHDALTQTDMNLKSQELYELWDNALNYLWGELELTLPEEEFAELREEQLIWIAEKERALEEAGKEFEGGSLYPLVVNSEAAKITEERVYEFYALLNEWAMH